MARARTAAPRPEQRISNVYKMYRVSRDHADTGIDPSQQVVFYDVGLGTAHRNDRSHRSCPSRSKLLGSVTGAGIKRNIADCYEFVVNHYRAGDRIYLSPEWQTVRWSSCANLLSLRPAKPVV